MPPKPRPNFLGSLQYAAVEVEVLLDKVIGERRSGRRNHMPAQVSLPIIEGHGGQQLIQGRKEFRLTHVDLFDLRVTQLAQVSLPGKVGGQALKFW